MLQENPDYPLHAFGLHGLPGKLEEVLQSICWGAGFAQVEVEGGRLARLCQPELLGGDFLLLLL